MGLFKGKRRKGIAISRVKVSSYYNRKRSLIDRSPLKSPAAKKFMLSPKSSTPFKSPRSKLPRFLWSGIETIFENTQSPLTTSRKKLHFKPNENLIDDEINNIEDSFSSLNISELERQEELESSFDKEYKSIFQILPSVLQNLAEANQDKTFIQFMKLVHENKFPLTNISFTLWMDAVKWFGLDDSRQMRYSPNTLSFFWVGWKLFGGRFIRFMSGLRNETAFLQGEDTLNPQESEINFACPSENILRDFHPLGEDFQVEENPGIMTSMIKMKSEQDNENKSYVLMFDGKKVRMGGDVDLLGFEKGETVKDRIKMLNENLKIIENAVEIFKTVMMFKVDETPIDKRKLLRDTLIQLHSMFSTVLYKLREIKKTKQIALSRLKEKAGNNWRSSKFVLAIDLCSTLIYKTDNAIEKTMTVVKTICKTGAYLNEVGHLFANSSSIDLNSQDNVRLLKPPDVIKQNFNTDYIASSLTKQRTDEWTNARKDKRVTGSSIYVAIGCDTLKRQKEHFDKVMSGVLPAAPSDQQQTAMQRGTECEVHQIATLSSIVLPFLFPDLVYYEEGYFITDDILVSPDGSLRSQDATCTLYAFEGKAPMGNVFTTPIHYQVPERYITQTMFEQRATGASLGTIYMSWSPECCTVFLVQENKTLCENIISEIQNVYFSRIPKRPSQLSDHSKQIKQDLIAASRTCTFLGEFPSVKGFISELSNSKMNENSESPYVLPVRTSNSTKRMTFDDILKSLISGKEIVNEAYELQRQMASQGVVVLLADLDRLWKSEEPHAVPVMYFFRGYSLSMEIMRQLMEKCKDECKRNGIDITTCSADGEFLQLMVRGKNNQPLTMHQLSKDIWAETNRLTKSQLIRKCIDASKLYSCTKHRISRIGLDKKERVVVSIEVKSDNGSVSNIRTPVKGWKTLKKPSKESPEMLELSEINDNIPNPNGNNSEPVLSDDDVIQTALMSATTERTENEASAASTPDLDETICYKDFSSLGNDKSKVVLNEKDISDILHLLQTSNERKWSKVKTNELSKYFSSADSLKKFIVKELIEITKFLKVKPEVVGKQLNLGKGITKIDLVNQLSQLVCDGSKLEKRVKRSRLRTVSSLKELAARAITKKQYPKEVLAIALCEYIWPQRVREWRQSSKVADKIQIIGLDDTFEPYYVPEFNQSTQEFNVFVYDKTHLGSNLRKAICVNKVEGISKKSWEKVATQNPELLNPVLLEVSEEGKIIDQMKEKLAKNMFSSLVEEQMMANGDEREANFCGIIRNALYIADDEPGISSLDRCRKRLAFINWLKEDVDFGKFPPYGARIKSLSYILYEGLRSSQEAKLYLYALAKQGTYCVRAPNTLCSESFFSTMQEMDPWGQGVLTTTGVRKHIKEFTTITALKMKEDRCFSIKTKKDAAYPMPSLPEGGFLFSDKARMCDCRRMKYISCIEPRDHFFDSRERARKMRRLEKPYRLSSLNEPTRGDLPIRSRYGYKINEAKILPSKRLGIKLDTF